MRSGRRLWEVSPGRQSEKVEVCTEEKRNESQQKQDRTHLKG